MVHPMGDFSRCYDGASNVTSVDVLMVHPVGDFSGCSDGASNG
jgi:hypothetical protein